MFDFNLIYVCNLIAIYQMLSVIAMFISLCKNVLTLNKTRTRLIVSSAEMKLGFRRDKGQNLDSI